MGFSFSTLLTTFICCSGAIAVFMAFLTRGNILKSYFGVACLIACIGVVAARMLFPIEFFITQALRFEKIIPIITHSVYFVLFQNDRYQIRVYHVLYVIWGIGIIVMACYRLIKHISTSRNMRAKFTELNDERVFNIANEIASGYKGKQKFKMVSAPVGTPPFVTGLKNPVIVIPEVGFSDEELVHILSHEIRHYYKKDIFFKVILDFLCIIYWWNPLAYYVKQEISKLIELNTDIYVTKPMDDDECVEYYNSIYKAARTSTDKERNIFYGWNFGGKKVSIVKQRFSIVFACRENTSSPFKKIVDSLVLAILITTLMVFSVAFVIEPGDTVNPKTNGTFSIKEGRDFLVKNESGGYDYYSNGKNVGTMNTIVEDFLTLDIYNTLEEALVNEKD